MSKEVIDSTPKDNLPRIVCAFAAFFTLAVPALALAVGRASHSLIVELVTQAEQGGIRDTVSVALLDAHAAVSWVLAVIAIALSVWTFTLARRNNTSGTLLGTGRIVFALGMSGMLSVFYLGGLLVAVGRVLTPFLLR